MNKNTVEILLLNIKFMDDKKRNRFAIEQNTKNFIRETGRVPKDYSEVRSWVNELIQEAERSTR